MLAMMLLAGSGEVLIAIRSEALMPWLISAVVPPIAPAATSPSEPGSWPASSAPMVAPAIGRITVWITSQTESTYGILSATASHRKSTAAAISTSVRSSVGGTESAPPNRPSSPSSSTTAYALIPLAQPLVKTNGTTLIRSPSVESVDVRGSPYPVALPAGQDVVGAGAVPGRRKVSTDTQIIT